MWIFAPFGIFIYTGYSRITAQNSRKGTVVIAVIANRSSINTCLIITNTRRAFTLAFRKIDIYIT